MAELDGDAGENETNWTKGLCISDFGSEAYITMGRVKRGDGQALNRRDAASTRYLRCDMPFASTTKVPRH